MNNPSVKRRVVLAFGLALVLAGEAREEKKLAESPVAGKTAELAAPTPVSERPAASPSGDGAAEANREGGAAQGTK